MRSPSLALFCLFGASLAAQTATYAVFSTPSLAVQPPDRDRALMAHDELRGRTLLAGGIANASARQDTWEWNGTIWQQVIPTTQLNFNRAVRLVWAAQRGQILAVLGDNSVGGSPMELHGWTGANWVLVTGNGPPSFGDGFNAAWDGQRGVLVVHSLQGTWEWDGATWQQLTTGGPTPRIHPLMVYDEARQRVVLYGGEAVINGNRTDTWEWNGIYWLERFSIARPDLYAANATMAYDRARQRVVLHGGSSVSGNNNGAVFEFDGTSWSQRTTRNGPTNLFGPSMAYHSASNRMVLYGGISQANYQRTRTMQFVTGYVASSVAHQAGCLGPAGVPTVAAVSGSRPALGTTFQVRFTNLPNTPAALVFAALGGSDQTWNGTPLPLDLTPIGYTSCMLRIEPATIELLSNNAGIANWGIAVPNTPSLDGAVFFLQGLVLTPGFNPGGGVTSSSLRATAGVL